jgi:hypothetical protein
MNQPSLFDDDAQKRDTYAGNAKEEGLVSSVAQVRELARKFFPLPPDPPEPRKRVRRPSPEEKSAARRRGMVAKWSKEFGFVSIHDPSSGEWHDVALKDASPWARWEARKRKELSKAGDRHAYELTSRHMAQIWEAEHEREEVEEGIVEEHPLEE